MIYGVLVISFFVFVFSEQCVMMNDDVSAMLFGGPAGRARSNEGRTFALGRGPADPVLDSGLWTMATLLRVWLLVLHAVVPNTQNRASFRCEMFLDFATVSLSFVFGKYCSIIN